MIGLIPLDGNEVSGSLDESSGLSSAKIQILGQGIAVTVNHWVTYQFLWSLVVVMVGGWSLQWPELLFVFRYSTGHHGNEHFIVHTAQVRPTQGWTVVEN